MSLKSITFSEKYRGAIRGAVIWAVCLAVWSLLVLDGGVSLRVFAFSTVGYIAVLLLVMFRRPERPSSNDLVFVAWGLPLMYFPSVVLAEIFFSIRPH